MATITVSISDESVTFLNSELASVFVDGDTKMRRASHVEPESAVLRPLFHALRIVCGDKGRAASFTRLWPCLWRVNLAPIGGPVLPVLFIDRAEAIRAEVAYIEANMHMLHS